MEIILRGEAVERAQAGDKCDFTGTLIVVPDVAQLNAPGAQAEVLKKGRGGRDGHQQEGIEGLKSLGVRDLTYRLAFLAHTVMPSQTRFGGGIGELSQCLTARDGELTAEMLKKQMTGDTLALCCSLCL